MGLCLAFVVSCSPTATAPSASPTPSPKSVTPTLSPTLTLTRPATFLPTPTATENLSLKTEICSPLAVLSLAQIPTYITQPFIAPTLIHNAEHPEWVQKDDGHHGVDIGYYQINGKLFTGTPVLAALHGQIAAIVHDRPPYGNMLIVETSFTNIPPTLVEKEHIPEGSSLYTLYAHLQALQTLTLGEHVTCGQSLAQTGLTGFTGGPHLHFETRWGPPNQTFASMAYYRADATAEEMKNYSTWRMSAVFHLFNAMELLGISSTFQLSNFLTF